MNNQSGLFKLNLGDIGRGLLIAILAGVILPVLAMVQTPGFDIAQANWSAILTLALNGGIAAGAGYITKNVFTADNGKLFGRI